MDSVKRTWSSPQLYQIRFLVTEKCRNGGEASLTITTTLHCDQGGMTSVNRLPGTTSMGSIGPS